MKHGFALIATTILTAIFLVTGTYFVTTSMTDLHIGQSHGATTRAYYLAESGLALMVYQLQNVETMGTAFVDGTLTNQNSLLLRSSVFVSGDGLEVYAVSSAPGEATLYATGTVPLGTNVVTRRIANQVSRALGGAVTDYSLLAGGNNEDLELDHDITIYGGILFGNDDVDISNNADVDVRGNGQVRAVDDIKIESGSTLTVNGNKTKEGVDALTMPGIDFDSSAPTSWRSQATQIMTTSQFNALPSGSVLTGIIFVTGSPNHFRKTLTINGLLVINGSFKLKTPGNLIINAGTGPSGLLAKSHLEIESDFTAQGLVYSATYLEIEYDYDDSAGTLDVTIDGGLIGQRVIIRREQLEPMNVTITHNPSLISRILNTEFNTTSPVVEIGHWEEQY
ncbi:MAG: hypothetical protein Q7S48_01640 [bacterium]|nr:hypothetical protein [bacterium]